MVCANHEEAPFAISAGARRKKPSSVFDPEAKTAREAEETRRGARNAIFPGVREGAQRGALTEEIGLSGAAEITCSTK